MISIFINPVENRLRAGWRILVFCLCFWVIGSIGLWIKPWFGEIGKRDYLEQYSLIIVMGLALAASLVAPWARRKIDRRSLASMGFFLSKRTWLDLLFGFGLSGFMAGIFLATLSIFNLAEIQGIQWYTLSSVLSISGGFAEFLTYLSAGSLVVFLIEHILVAYWEELVFRGYLFHNFKDGLGLKGAILLSCLLYGLVHAFNPHASIISTSIITLFGLLRIYGLLLSKQLWLSMGMHIGWNFFQGPIFGFAASGHQTPSLYQIDILGPSYLSGGNFGPEGSILILPILGFAFFLMHLWNKSMQSKPR